MGLGKALAHAIGGELPEELRAGLRGLSRHCIAARCPDAYPVGTPGEHYGAEDADIAIAQAKDVVDFVASCWQQLGEEAT